MIDKLTAFIKDKQGTTGWKKWLWGGAIVAAIVVVSAVLVIRSTLTGGKLAKTKHARDVALEKVRQSERDVALAANKAERLKHLKQVNQALVRVDALNNAVDDLESSRQKDLNTIGSIKTWKDVDEKVK